MIRKKTRKEEEKNEINGNKRENRSKNHLPPDCLVLLRMIRKRTRKEEEKNEVIGNKQKSTEKTKKREINRKTGKKQLPPDCLVLLRMIRKRTRNERRRKTNKWK